MAEPPKHLRGTDKDPLVGSRDVSRSVLGTAKAGLDRTRLRGPEDDWPATAALADRLRTIRTCIGHIPPAPSAIHDSVRQAGARLGVALTALPSGERRRFARWPLVRPCLLTLRGLRTRASTLDIGAGGLMLAPLPVLGPGEVAAVMLALSPGDRTAATIRIDRDGVGHLVFDRAVGRGPAELSGLLLSCAAAYETSLSQAGALAKDVEALFEAALRRKVLAPGDLFAPVYRPAVLALFDDVLAPLLVRAVPADADLAYVASVDRQGYVAAECAGPNGFPSRRGRHVRDAVTLRAACFATGPIVQTYCRLPGREPEGVVGDISAPVFVGGRRWGCVQIGRNPVSFKAD